MSSDIVEAVPKVRRYLARQITEDNIRQIADSLDEYVFEDPDGETRMSLGEESIPAGWWVVWVRGLHLDRNFYSDNEFHAMYKIRRPPFTPRLATPGEVKEGDTYVARHKDGEWTIPSQGPVTRHDIDRVVLLESRQ